MNRIRVLVSARSRMLQDILIDTIKAESDMEVVGHTTAASDLLNAINDAAPDILVVSGSPSSPRVAWDELAKADGPLKMLVIVDNERRGLIYELRPCRALRGEISPGSLVEAIRAATAPGDNLHPEGSA